MGVLEGKNVLVFGVANKNSIAWGITQALHEAGARVGLSYAGEVLKKRVMPLAESLHIDFMEECDVLDDTAIDRVFDKARSYFGGKLDILIHAVAFATREDLEGQFSNTSRSGFSTAMNVSVYSLVALAQHARALMTEGGAILTLTYYGSEKVMPHYNVMGVAKAALEASTRYLAYDLGAQKIRVNAISPGPIKTLSAAGIPGFRDMLRFSEMASPLQTSVTIEDVGAMALWLCSDAGKMITGQTLYIDAGYSIMGIPLGALEALEKKQDDSPKE